MGHYDDCYYEAHKYEFEREAKAQKFKKRLIDEISHDDMIKIMFTHFIKTQDVSEIIKIGEEYLQENNSL